MPERELEQLRELLRASADPEHAKFHKAYHKSSKYFYGLRTPQLKSVFRQVFTPRERLDKQRALALADTLALSEWAEENWLSVMLLARIQRQLTLEDLPILKRHCDRSDGWAWLDGLALTVLGPMAFRLEGPVYDEVRRWSGDPHLWTRRASILVHIVPARLQALSHAHAWPTFEERLHEKDFFIRKAIGWTLRECSKHYPQEILEFLVRVKDRASGLTFREGSRNLPPELKARLYDIKRSQG